MLYEDIATELLNHHEHTDDHPFRVLTNTEIDLLKRHGIKTKDDFVVLHLAGAAYTLSLQADLDSPLGTFDLGNDDYVIGNVFLQSIIPFMQTECDFSEAVQRFHIHFESSRSTIH